MQHYLMHVQSSQMICFISYMTLSHETCKIALHYWKSKKIISQLPKTPRSSANVIEKIITTISPQKQRELERRGIKHKLEDSFVVDSIKSRIYSLRNTRMTDKNRRECQVLAHGACNSVGKYSGMKKRVARFLGIGGKVLREKNFVRKKRKDVIPETTRQTIQEFWFSEGISREVPLKKRVKKMQPPFLLECSYTQAYRCFREKKPYCKSRLL